MLNLFGSEKVPGLGHIQLYRDDERPELWHMVTDRVSVARDDDGDPLLTFILYARDLDRLGPDDAEIERGWLGLTTQVAVTEEEEQKILTHLRAKLAAERAAGSGFLRLIGRARGTVPAEPVLTYPPEWTDGTVTLSLLGPDLVPHTYGSGLPSLISTNLASFAADVGQDGAELLRQVIAGGDVPAIAEYKLTFLARIPAVEITISGDRREFFREAVRHYTQTHSQTTDVDWWGFIHHRYTTYWTTSITTMEQFRSQFQSVTIEIDDRDFRSDPDAAAMRKQLEDMALALFKDTVMPSMFAPLAAIPPEQRTNFDSVQQTLRGTVRINIKRSAVIEKQINPNSQLRDVLTPEEIKTATSYLDLGQPMFTELAVKVHANVDFEHDPVFGLKVFVDYDQRDEVRGVRVKKAKEFLIQNADQVQRFRVLMAKTADGAPKDTYRYWSKLIYRETGDEIRVPAGEGTALESRDREQVVSYRRLGFRKVTLSLGSMPESVRSVQVRMTQPGSSEPSAQQSFELTAAQPTAVFFTHTGREDPEPYRYQATYVLADRQRMDLAEQPSQSETLVLGDPFEQTATTRFVAQGDFTVVDKVIVDATYTDRPNDLTVAHHAELTSNGASSDWTVGLRNPDLRGFTYRVVVLHTGGARQEQPERRGTLGETTFVGLGAVDALEIKVVPNFDAATYRMALVEVQYDDGAGTRKQESYRLQPDDAEAEFRVLLRDATKRSYRYRVRFVAVPPAANADTGWQEAEDTFLLVQWPL